MREILFKGKLTWCDDWVYGNYAGWEGPSYITSQEEEGEDWEVYPETIGQYTGLKDKNGIEIFEGDIVMGLFLHAEPIKAVCKFKDGSFGLAYMRGDIEQFNAFTSMCNVEYEVVGNIHDDKSEDTGNE